MSDSLTLPTIYPYRIRMRLTHKKSKQFEVHEVPVKAYSMNDAMLQSMYQLKSDLDINLDDYDITILQIGPDFEARTKVPGMVPSP